MVYYALRGPVKENEANIVTRRGNFDQPSRVPILVAASSDGYSTMRTAWESVTSVLWTRRFQLGCVIPDELSATGINPIVPAKSTGENRPMRSMRRGRD